MRGRAVLAALFVVVPARADDAADTATARALGIDGVVLADAGRCPEAIEKLDRAEKLHHAPTTATRLGECEIEIGKIVAGTERLQRVVRERLPANAHPAIVAAVARAQSALDRALPRLASVRLSIAAPSRGAAITIDGERASDAIVDTDRKIDPGTHTIEVRAEGFIGAREAVTLREGESRPVRFELRPDLAARPAVRQPMIVERPEPPSKVPAAIAFGASAIGLGLGLYGAFVVDAKASRLEGGCDANRVCPPELQKDLRDARTWATISTGAFIGAGVLAATGIALLLLPSGDRTTARLRLRPGAGGAVLDGTF
jgi:hypothetical protein